MREFQEDAKLAMSIVDDVLDDLLDRRGFKQVWDDCDLEVRQQITESLLDKVYNRIVTTNLKA